MLFKNICQTLTLALIMLGMTGCTPEAEITQYKIKKDRSGLELLRKAQLPPAPAAKQSETRMIVALFEEADATWFFKISGDPDKVESSKKQWEPFLKSITFKEGDPVFETPDGWSEAAAKPMRYKTFVMGESELELAISNLSSGQDLLLNANRWRKQIGLGAATKDQVETQLPVVETESGEFRLFDQTGMGSGQMSPPFAGGGMSGAPFANGSASSGGGSASFAGGAASSAQAKVTFEVPDGWETGKTSSMVQARLKKKVDAAEAMITIIEMPADANEWAPNVIRWAGQVQMGDLSKEDLDGLTSTIEVDGVEGKLVKLIDLDSEASENAILAGMVKRDGSAWFLKLSGEKKLVVETQEEFMSFLESIRFK